MIIVLDTLNGVYTRKEKRGEEEVEEEGKRKQEKKGKGIWVMNEERGREKGEMLTYLLQSPPCIQILSGR